MSVPLKRLLRLYRDGYRWLARPGDDEDIAAFERFQDAFDYATDGDDKMAIRLGARVWPIEEEVMLAISGESAPTEGQFVRYTRLKRLTIGDLVTLGKIVSEYMLADSKQTESDDEQ